ncbi:MAG: serine/threonine protein kinase [Myxococcaceae bacterium]|nr:serine/threonine protein kinase [Myxococcaceae bacterium]
MRKLATGGMAEVYLAKVAGPGGFEKLVVLKQILPQLSDNEVYIKMFLSEARLAAQLDHPNIVHVFDFGEADGAYFLTMEFVDGANLRQVLRWAIRSGHGIAPTIAARIIANACEGLAYAHEFVPPGGGDVMRLVHRDVSPENIMLSRIGGVKMLDFGVAKATTEDHRSKVGSLKGKIAYMPPEQIKGKGMDHRVDIYALGVVLYQTLSGKRPYGQATDVQLINAIMTEEPTPLLKHRLDLPDNLLEIVAKAMHKEPAKRFQSCLEMRDALEAYIAHEGTPANATQIAALVQAYQAANPDGIAPKSSPAQPHGVSAGGTGDASGEHGSRSRSGERSTGQATPKPRDAGVIDQLMSAAAVDVPVGLRGVQAKTQPHVPSPIAPPPPPPPPAPRAAAAAGPIPAMPDGPPSRPSMPSFPAMPATPEAPAGALPQVRRWVSSKLGAEPIRHALREGLRADRSSHLLRKLPAVIGRLAEYSRTIPWSVTEALAGVLDAAALADDHTAIARIVDRAEARPGRERRFANLVMAELHSPLRIAWLVERLRSGLPADTSGLRAWLGRLGPGAGPMLVDALEASDPGPVQELFAEALAYALPADPSLVIARLEGTPKLRNVAALTFALEKSGVPERTRVFQTLLGRREVPLLCEVLTGRARARGEGGLSLLEGALGDKTDEVRKRALELIGELGGAKGFALLQRLLHEPAFESRPPAERSRLWAALLESGREAALAEVDAVLLAKPSMLAKKKVNDAKLTVIEGLARARNEVAQKLLERTANDPGQGDEIHTASRSALAGTRVISGEQRAFEQKAVGERRTHIIARVVLDLVLLSRASTTIDSGSGLLDPAIEHLRDGLRQLLAQDGRVSFVAEPVPTLNGAAVSFAPFHDAVVPAVIGTLQARDLKGFLVEAMLPLAEYRSFMLRAFDPDGRHERLPHVKALTWAGVPLTAVSDAPAAADANARAKEIFAALVRWLHAQREGVRRGAALSLQSADPFFEEWSRIMGDAKTEFLGVARWAASDTGTLVHAVNTAALSMAFAHDLGLPRSAIREACELSLLLGLAEAIGPADKRPPAGEPTAEDQRFHAAGLLLTNRLNRLGTAAAVAAIEAGLPADTSGKGPGLLASIHALAKTFDQLTAGQGLGAAQALEQINGPQKVRFSNDLLGLFTQWAFAQGTLGP